MLVFRSLVVGLLGGIFLLQLNHLHEHMHEHSREARAPVRAHTPVSHTPIATKRRATKRRAATRRANARRAHPRPARCMPPPRTPRVTARARAVTPDTALVDITRASLDRLVADNAAMARVRLIPRVGTGQLDGFTVYNIAPGSLLDVLGLRAGDKLLAINDLPLSSLSSNYFEASRPDFLDISLERDGTPMRIVVLIH